MSRTLVVSISGIRGIFGAGLDPEVIVRYASSYGDWIRGQASNPSVVVGRDARVSGPVCADLVMRTLQSQGIEVLDAGLATTPTVEMAVLMEGATGGIVLSASHNPAEWNALKLLNGRGEFLSPADAQRVIDAAAQPDRQWAAWDALGGMRSEDYLERHVEAVCGLDGIEPDRIADRDFRIVVDAVNSVGGIALPALLRRLGVRDEQIIRLHCEPTGRFAHPAEPLPENLTEIIARVGAEGADLGLVVDPDADRLVLIADGGVYVSEELTQVLAADFWWQSHQGPFATNLSSSRAIEDVARRHGQEVYRSAVGEINVVERMKEVGAAIGGEGNGGVILPDLHYGRDALVGAALVLQRLADTGASLSEWVADMPTYHMAKTKTDIGSLDPDRLLARMAERYRGDRISTVDGVKVDLDEGWVHMRKSNTEPIIRVYSEAGSAEAAHALAGRFMQELLSGA
ncbi:MAG: phosphoglucosamine mutase [Bacteroidetes bacterium]|nr:phosphoglucosamine mutase [Bacteroidota bacterium]